jgi:iron complex outermembrane receptor protein
LRVFLAIGIAWGLLFGAASAQHSPDFDLTELSLEALMDIQVTSVSKKSEKISRTAAAVFVITNEDIRHSGYATLAEALKLAPGVHVARLSSHTFSVSTRGFGGEFANKLLVLVDGRSVYSPMFSGVYWDQLDIPLSDIERIEIIRGPGATLWGANAVNGVINVITKHARDTEGGQISIEAGTRDRASGVFRLGGTSGKSHWRFYGKYHERERSLSNLGAEAHDGMNVRRLGYRLDREVFGNSQISLFGDYSAVNRELTNRLPQMLPPYTSEVSEETHHDVLSIMVRLATPLSEQSDMMWQAYFERSDILDIVIKERRSTIDVDFHHRTGLSERAELIWGAGYRYITDDIDSTFAFYFSPSKRDVGLVSGFGQLEFELSRSRLSLTVGSKFEHNSYTGFEYQPSVRLLYTPSTRHSFWAAVSRAVRTPSRYEHDSHTAYVVIPATDEPGSLPTVVGNAGDRDMEAEKLLSTEVGYRGNLADALYLDVTSFHQRYDDLWAIEFGAPEVIGLPPQYLLMNTFNSNGVTGNSYGVEMVLDWRVSTNIRVRPVYAYLKIDLQKDSELIDDRSLKDETNSPKHQASLQSIFQISPTINLTTAIRYVDEIPRYDVDSYWSADLHLQFALTRDLDLSVVGNDLLDEAHAEYGSVQNTQQLMVERTVRVALQWRF